MTAARKTHQPRRPPELVQEAVKRYAEGESSIRIGSDLGVTSMTVLKWARQAGVEIRSKGHRVNHDRVDPEVQVERKKARQNARYQATIRLVERHQAEFDDLFAEERAKLGG